MPDSDGAEMGAAMALESAWPPRPSHPDGLCAAPYAAAQVRNRPRQLARRHLVLPAKPRRVTSDESARLALAISVPGVGIILAVISRVAAQASRPSPQCVSSASTCLPMFPEPSFPHPAPLPPLRPSFGPANRTMKTLPPSRNSAWPKHVLETHVEPCAHAISILRGHLC